MSGVDILQSLTAPRILVIRFARLGDVILLVPALNALRQHWPRARIDVLVGHRCASVLEMCNAVDQVIAVDRIAMRDGSWWQALRTMGTLAERVRKARYDVVIDLHSFRETNLLAWYSRAPWRLGLKRDQAAYLARCFNLDPILEDKTQHASAVYLSMITALGKTAGEANPRLDLVPADLERSRLFLQEHGIDPEALLVGLNVGAGSAGRVWPLPRFADLARRLIRIRHAAILIFSGPQDSDSAAEVANLIGTHASVAVADRLSLSVVASLLSRCRLLVSNDTGPMHLGPAVGVPTLGLFSLGYPENYHPLGPNSRFIKRSSMEAITVDDVHAQAEEMLSLH